MTVRLATWNIFGGRTWDGARVDLDLTLATLRRLDADLVALQEVDRDLPRSGRVDQARALGEALGMDWRFAPALLGPGGGAYGIALLSRLPLGGWRRSGCRRAAARSHGWRRSPRWSWAAAGSPWPAPT